MLIRMSEEVREAVSSRRAVVALETSVVAQGLPRPHNLTAARACEAAVRAAGAVPATIAVLDGVAWAGLNHEQLERLGAGEEPLLKIGSRDLPIAMARGLSGGTTVSATCELAALAGIGVFATGGIGGVHRGVEEHLDVSQDLRALSRFPVAVVCAGAKSVLDLPKTMEALETLAVPVIGVATNELPSFFSRESGLKLEHRVDSAQEAARITHLRFALGQGGLVFAQPPPENAALPATEIDEHIEAALLEAKSAGIKGKAVTPFLLGELARRTAGRTLAANLALLEHNARFAGQLAVALSRLG